MDLPVSPYYTERVHRNYKDMFTIIWLLTRTCNFSCNYCVRTNDPLTPFDIDKFIEKLNELPKPFRLQITGGEPLIFSWITELINKVGRIGGVIELQTNFSLQVRELLDSVSPKVLEYILVSHHPAERVRIMGEGAIQKLIDDIKYARSKGFYVMIWNIDDPRIGVDQFMADCKVMYDAGITVVRKRYTGDEGGGQAGDAVVGDLKGKRCLAGCKSFNMWENFDMTLCDTDRTPLGNLFTGYKLLEAPGICKAVFCGCGGRELVLDTYYDSYFKKEFGGEK